MRLDVGRLLFSAGFVVLTLLAGCTSPTPLRVGSFCSAAESVSATCKKPSDCDGPLTTGCASLEKALSPSMLVAARDCLESGVCGATSCVGRAKTSVVPTDAHLDLATSYCTTCAPDVSGCEGNFYARKSKLPGGLVLPYGEAIARAVAESCTIDASTCRSEFAVCAIETIERAVGDAVGPDIASCVVTALRSEEGGTTGPGGGPTISTCTPSNCEGCCRDDRCEKGDTEASCGAGGGACQKCSGEQSCKAGACKEPCGPTNCAGCCDGDTCLPGTATDKCGGEGAACTTCATEGPSFVCSNQQCIDGSCQATCATGCCSATGCQPGTEASACGTGGEGCYACGAGRRCDATTRVCVLDPNALWDVFIAKANIPPTDKNGAAWDTINAAPDAWVKVLTSEGTSSHSGETTVIDDSTTPVWNETVISTGVKSSELMNNFALEVWDSDLYYHDYIGGCRVGLAASSFGGTLQLVRCSASASGVAVEVFFRLNPHR